MNKLTMTRETTTYTPLAKVGIARAVFGSQDLGSNSIEEFTNLVLEGSQMEEPERDLLSAYIIQSLNKNDSIEAFETDLDYAISMLQRARASIQPFLK